MPPAIDEYRESGRDVYMYSDNEADLWGRGAAYNEIVSAIQNRGVQNVAIIGYSHGGGSAYSLAWRLQQNTIAGSGISDITNPFLVPFTAYVAAIRDGGFDPRAERRPPPLSLFHCNQYETNNTLNFLNTAPSDPNPSGGLENIDRSNLGVDHGTIEDHPLVHDKLRSRFRYIIPK